MTFRARPLRHCVWYEGFGRHSGWGPRSAHEVALTLKALALFFRGVVVADADLNNHKAFQGLLLEHLKDPPTDPDLRTLYDALEWGFIVRAARKKDGAVPSQLSVFEGFKKENPADEAAVYSPDHPRFLDELFGRTNYDPLIYDVAKMSGIYARRIGVNLVTAGESSELAAAVQEYVRTRIKDGLIVTTTEMEAILKNGDRDPGAVDRVRRILGESYNGNVAAFFSRHILYGGELGTLRSTPMAGPGSDRAEQTVTEQVYTSMRAGPSGPGGRTQLVVRYGTGDEVKSQWRIDLGTLDDLTFAMVEGIREHRDPSAYFDLRFDMLASSSATGEGTLQLAELEDEHHASMVRHCGALARRLKPAASPIALVQPMRDGREAGEAVRVATPNALGGVLSTLLDPAALATLQWPTAPAPRAAPTRIASLTTHIRLARFETVTLRDVANKMLYVEERSDTDLSPTSQSVIEQTLRRELCDLHNSHGAVKSVLRLAELDADAIDPTGPLLDVWQRVMEFAIKRRRIVALVMAATKDLSSDQGSRLLGLAVGLEQRS